jgi:hypothetical protein
MLLPAIVYVVISNLFERQGKILLLFFNLRDLVNGA